MQVLEIETVAPRARNIAPRLARLLDFDHIGAPIRQLAHRSRPGAGMTKVEHGKTGERQGSDAHYKVPPVLDGIGCRPYTRRAQQRQVSAAVARLKRFLRRTPSRGGRTRGGSLARIAMRANRVV